MRRWLGLSFVIVTFILLSVIAIRQIRQKLPTPQELAAVVEAEMTSALGVPVRLKKAEVSITGAKFRNLQVLPDNRSPTGYFLTVPELRLRWSLRQILFPSQWHQAFREQMEKAMRQIFVSDATMFLWRDKEGRLNAQQLLKVPRRPIPSVRFQDSTLIFCDETLPLPDGVPFQLRLTSVNGEIRHVNGGTELKAQGVLQPPSGTDGSVASLSLLQLVNEGKSEGRGRLRIAKVRINALPQQWRWFFGNRLRIGDGDIADCEFQWQKSNNFTSLTGVLKTQQLTAVWDDKRPVRLHPADALIAIALKMENRYIRSWQVSVQLLKSHLQLGDGKFVVEGRRKEWGVRWSGSNLPVATLQHFTDLPLRQGKLSGSFSVEQGQRWRIDADVHVRGTKIVLSEFNLPALKTLQVEPSWVDVQHAHLVTRLERDGSHWRGSVDVIAKGNQAQVQAKTWLNGEEGIAQVQANNVPLGDKSGFGAIIQALLLKSGILVGSLKDVPVHLQGGFLSGQGKVAWKGRKWCVEKAGVRVHDALIVSEEIPPIRLSAQASMHGQSIKVSKVSLRWDKGSLVVGSGNVNIEGQPLWQVQGKFNEQAIETISGWLTHRFRLPMEVLQGGKAIVSGGGAGKQWNAQAIWDSPTAIVAPKGERWKTHLNRLTFLASPQGGTVIANAAQGAYLPRRLIFGNVLVDVPETVRLGEWRIVWDAKGQAAVAYGQLSLPKIHIGDLPITDVQATVSVHGAASKEGWKISQVQLRSFQAEALDGHIRDGWLTWNGEMQSGQAKFQFENAVLEQLRNLPVQLPVSIDGDFSGSVQVSVQVSKGAMVQAFLQGEVKSLGLQATNHRLQAERVKIATCSFQLEDNDGKWQLTKVGGDGTAQGLTMALDEKRQLQWERLQAQGFAEQKPNGFSWDVRIPNGKMLGGKWSGQANGQNNRTKGHLSFADADVTRITALARKWGLTVNGGLPKGKSSGWLKWTNKDGDTGQGRRDKVIWEVGATVTNGSWNDWTVKVAGLRAEGEFQLQDASQKAQGTGWELKGNIEGLHLLSDDGQVVLSGEFEGKGKQQTNATLMTPNFALTLKGRWGAVSLNRIAQRFNLPKPLKGIASGTVQIQWNGEWQAKGTAQCDAVAIGETILEKATSDWNWSGNTVRISKGSALLDGSTVRCEGFIGTAKSYPTTLTLNGDDVASASIAKLLRDWDVTIGDWQWQGKSDWKAQIFKTTDEWRTVVSLNSQDVALGDAPLGALDLDFQMTQTKTNEQREPVTSFNGQVSLLSDSARITARIDGRLPNWKVSWRGGKVSLSVIKAIAAQWTQQVKNQTGQRWLKLPLNGEVWTHGEAKGNDKGITEMDAELSAPRLRGVGDTPVQLKLILRRDGSNWQVSIAKLQQDGATASGAVQISDDGQLRGQLQTDQISQGTLIGMLQLLGIEADKALLPDGAVSASVKLSGTMEHPNLEGNIQADDVRWFGWSIERISVRRFELRDDVLRINKGDAELRWDKPATPTQLWGTLGLNGEREVSLWLELPKTPLSVFIPKGLPIKIRDGWLKGRLQLGGSLIQPKMDGSLTGEAKEMSVGEGKTTTMLLTDCHFNIVADGKMVKLKEFQGKLKGGFLSGTGFIILGKGGLQDFFANDGQLTLRLKNTQTLLGGTMLHIADANLMAEVKRDGLLVQLERLNGDGFHGKGQVKWEKEILMNETRKNLKAKWLDLVRKGIWDLTLRLDNFRWQTKGAQGRVSGSLALRTHQEDEPSLSGNLTFHDGNIARLPLVGGAGVQRWQFPPAVRFAVTARTGENLFLRNLQVTVLLNGEFRLTGNLSQPRAEVQVRGRRGILRLPAATLTMTEMEFDSTYTVDPLNRQWQGTARLRVEGETQMDVHRIIFTVSGPVDEQSQRMGILPIVTMLATPPLPERTMLERMFGLGLAQLGEVLTDWELLFSGAFVRSFMGDLLVPVTSPIAEALRLSELAIVREQMTGRQWLRLGVPLSPRLHVLWRQGLSSRDPSALEVQYFLGKRTSVTWTKRERERAEIRLQTSVRF